MSKLRKKYSIQDSQPSDYKMLIQVCDCGRICHLERWFYDQDLYDVIKRSCKDLVKDKNADIIIPEFDLTFESKSREKIEVKVKREDGDADIHIEVRQRVCNVCEKKKSNYFEGILQLRKPTPAVKELVFKELEKLEGRGVFVTKTSELENGVDLYFSSKTHMKMLAENLHRRFGGILKLSEQLFSRNSQTSKDIFRLNAYVEFPDFEEKSIITFIHKTKKHELEILAEVINLGKNMTARDLKSGKKSIYEMRFMHDIKVIPKENTTVSSIIPEVEVLDPQDYQNKPLVNSYPEDLKNGEKIKVVKFKGELYFV